MPKSLFAFFPLFFFIPNVCLATDSLPNVELFAERGAIENSTGKPVLQFDLMVKNRLSVPIYDIELGVLYAESQEQLAGADPAKLFLQKGNAQVGATTYRSHVKIGPQAQKPLHLRIPLKEIQQEPKHFVAHVLAYKLESMTADLALELIHSDQPCDERAVVETLALTGNPKEKDAARERFGDGDRKDNALVQSFVDIAKAPVPKQAKYRHVLDRVLAIRALGVLKGPMAKNALIHLSVSKLLEPLDAPLQVISIARRQGSMLETPLAFAVPHSARHMKDVVLAALDDLEGKQNRKPEQLPNMKETQKLKHTPDDHNDVVPAKKTLEASNAPENKSADHPAQSCQGWVLGVLVVCLLLGFGTLLRRRL